MGRDDIRKIFEERIRESEIILADLKKKLFIISLARLIIFFACIVLILPAFSLSVIAGIAEILVFLSIFLLLVKQYSLYTGRITFWENIISINKAELKALQGDFSSFDGGERWKNKDHDYSNDIDLFGDNSLFRYLNRTVTAYGREILASWLSDSRSFTGGIKERQDAVKELAPEVIWRQEFLAYGLGRSPENEGGSGLRDWLENDDSFFSSKWLKSVSAISPVVTITLLLLAIFNLLPFSIFSLIFILNLFLTLLLIKKTGLIHSLVSRKYLFLSSFEKLISTFDARHFRAKILVMASEKLYSSGRSAAAQIKDLSRIIQAFDSRLNLFAGILLNGLVLWDLKCISRLEKWKHDAADQLPVWLETIGEIDALISLSNHAFNNPTYTFPVISDGAPLLEASGMGHPLINPEVRICNDFLLERPGRICIVTGANMSGKSTFLRTIAVNLILAMAGTSVCADQFIFKPLRLFSGMRTTDSLSDNESYFYAELKRLRKLKELIDNEEDLIFILDEILKGTNSEDKSTGSKLFLAGIAASNGTGIIATHDISLGSLEKEFPERIFNKCFEVETEGESLVFDYRLRDGITQHMNAGILMRQMGII